MEEQAQSLYRGEALAPMVRASTTPLRALALEYGADFVYTEELIDRSITASIRCSSSTTDGEWVDYARDVSQKSQKAMRRLLQAGEQPPLLLRIDPSIERSRLVCQIASGEPELALDAALHVHQDVAAIDINMGCPKRFSVSGGMGSALLSDPERATRIIRTLSGALPIPVSAKIRLLKDTTSTIDFVSSLINAGAKAVAIHGRRVGDESTTPAHWDALRETVSICSSKFPRVPILVNGDFYTRQEFEDFQKATGAAGVLLGRPALYNTSIFRKPNNDGDSGPFRYDSPLLLDKTRVVQDYLRHAIKYDYHYKNVKYVISEMMSNRRTPTPRVPYLPQIFSGGQTIGKTCDCHSLEALCRVWSVNYSATHRSEAMPAGEHAYLDSYWASETTAKRPPTTGSSESSPKKLRTQA